mgnify:CR=1 FL=1
MRIHRQISPHAFDVGHVFARFGQHCWPGLLRAELKEDVQQLAGLTSLENMRADLKLHWAAMRRYSAARSSASSRSSASAAWNHGVQHEVRRG